MLMLRAILKHGISGFKVKGMRVLLGEPYTPDILQSCSRLVDEARLSRSILSRFPRHPGESYKEPCIHSSKPKP